MPFKDGREYRSFELMQPVSDGGYVVEGYATTFDDPYDFGRGTKEVIESGALDGADMSDVIFQVNHEGLVLARLRNGTMLLERDGHGLRVRADLGGSQQGRELHEAIKNGLVDRMSWGFAIAPGGWRYDEATRTSYISKIEKVFDVSAVSIPANEGTEIHARSYIDGVIEAEGRESAQRKAEQEERARVAAFLEII